MSATVRFLAGFCREHPLDEKIFIAPSFVAGREIGEALARESGAWINLRFVTVAALASLALGKEGGAGTDRPMTSSAELALVDRLFRELCAEGRLEYFGRAAASPGLAQALHRAVRELRLDGRGSADLEPGRFLVPEKGRELRRLLERYERTLEAEGLLDLPAFLTRARRAAGRSPAAGWILCPADVPLRASETDLVRAMAGDRLVLVPGDPVFGLERPRRCWPARPPAEPAAARMSWLFAPGAAPPPRTEPRIDIFRALGPANECREILRRLYAGKVPFDQAEVLVPAGSPHATIFHLLASRTGLPVTFGDGLPVSFSAPGRLFFGLADWLAGDFASDDLCRLLETGDLDLAGGGTELAFTPRTACRLLRSAMIGWGRDRYLERLSALRDGKEADLGARLDVSGCDEGDEAEAARAVYRREIAEIDELRAALGRLLAGIPGPDAKGRYDLASLGGAFAALIRSHGRAATDLDRQARRALLDRLDGLVTENRSPAMPLREALDLIRSAGASVKVGASPPLAGRLHVAAIPGGGYSGRPLTFVAGLDEASFPGRGLQDPVLLDEERAAISSSLPTSSDILRGNLFGLAAVLASLPGRLVLSFSSYDLIDGRPSFPSSVVLQAFRLLRGEPDLDYASLDRSLPAAAGFLPGGRGRAFDEVEWWLDRLTTGPRPDGWRSVAVNFPDLAAGLAAVAARRGAKLTAYDGLVDIAPLRAEVDPLAGTKAVMSATRLEFLAKCPFGYFLRHVLGVKPPEEVSYDRTRWLDPLQRGGLIHEILQVFMAEVARRGEDVQAARHAPLMAELAESRLARTLRAVPPPSSSIFESERLDILETLGIFLSAEETRERKGRPFAFEKEIVDEPIVLGEGRSFRLRGFIDRVDLLGKNAYRIIDYKTGSPRPYEDLVHFGRGRTLQPTLYALALEQIEARARPGTNPVVVESGYLFPSRRGEGDEIMVRNFDRERLRALLGDLLRLLEKGYFFAGPEAKCDYCDYRAACVSGGPASAKAKRDANPGVFEAYAKLDEYK
jgi:RecB family exonuclease